MDKELKLFRDILLAIWDNHRKPWLYPRGQARDIYLEIEPTFSSMTTREELEMSLPTEGRVSTDFPRSRFLYLSPVNRNQVLLPVLRLKCDFGRSIPEIRLRVGVFLRYNLDIRAIGYRFESPEGVGIHHYYHMQMIRGFQLGVPFLPDEYLTWMPDSAPTFPLDVDSPVKLLISLLISLYGLTETGRVLRDSGLETQTKAHLSDMHCYSMPPIEWYWRVFKKGVAGHTLHKTSEEPKEFRKLHAGFRLVGITKDFYDVQTAKKRR